MPVRTWWNNAKEHDQEAVLTRLGLDCSLTGIPWAFLPDQIQSLLARRVRIKTEQLDPDWRRAEQD
jgi:hypothetical protein